MEKSLFIISIFCLSISNLIGQEVNTKENPSIEIYGISEKEIEPNEIYIEVILKERYEGRNKISIIEQEQKLIAGMKSINISGENIKLSDSESGYVKVKWLKEDVITTKNYVIKVSNANQVRKVFTKLDEIEIQNASITRINHSEIEYFEKQVRVEAIKDARDKAKYLLEAIDEKLGNPIKIFEVKSEFEGVTVRGSRSGATDYYIDGVKVRGTGYLTPSTDDFEVQYQKIKLRAVIYTKFEIE